jgi:hypothetical protein
MQILGSKMDVNSEKLGKHEIYLRKNEINLTFALKLFLVSHVCNS